MRALKKIDIAGDDGGELFLADRPGTLPWLLLSLSLLLPVLSVVVSFLIPGKFATIPVVRNLTAIGPQQTIQCTLLKILPVSEIISLRLRFDNVKTESMSFSGDLKLTCAKGDVAKYSLDSPVVYNGLVVENGKSHPMWLFYHDMLDYDTLHLSLTVQSPMEGQRAILEWTVVDTKYSLIVTAARLVLSLCLLPSIILCCIEMMSSSVVLERQLTMGLGLAVVCYNDPAFGLHMFFPSRVWCVWCAVCRDIMFAYGTFYCVCLLSSFSNWRFGVRTLGFAGFCALVLLVIEDVRSIGTGAPILLSAVDLRSLGTLSVGDIFLFDVFVGVIIACLPRAFTHVKHADQQRLILYTISLLVYILICAVYIFIDKLTNLFVTTLSREIISMSIFTGFCLAMQAFHASPGGESYDYLDPHAPTETSIGVDTDSP